MLAQDGERAFLGTALVSTTLTITLDWLLYRPWSAAGLAVAFAVGAWVQALLCGLWVLRCQPDGIRLGTLVRWASAAIVVGRGIGALSAPKGVVGVGICAVVVLVAHGVILALFGERELFTRAFWSLRHRPAQVIVGS